jgi:hypothetical protein
MIPIDEEYFTWLYSKVANVNEKNSKKSYWMLCNQLYTKEFLWFVPNDDNRSEEGIELRKVFVREKNIFHPGQDWMHMSCSMLELLIAMSNRLAFLDDRPSRVWFWELIDNLDLTYATDNRYDIHVENHVEDTLDRVIWRLYEKNGAGGLFPLRHANEDQRKVELWYQLSSYVNEELWP